MQPYAQESTQTHIAQVEIVRSCAFYSVTFSEKLKSLMMQRGDTQESLGDELGVAHTSVGRWLNGSMPRPNMLAILAKRFGVSSKALADDSAPLPQTVIASNPNPPLQNGLVTGYTRPVPVKRMVAEEGEQAPYDVQLNDPIETALKFRELWHQLTPGQQAKAATAFLEAMVQEIKGGK